MSKPLLTIQDLTVSFGTTKALHGVSFSIQKGKITAVVGESGSGKSITALSVLGLLPKEAKTNGKIFFYEDNSQERDLLQADKKTIQDIRGNRISMIFQEPMTSLNPLMRCGEQITEVLIQHKKITPKQARALAIQLLEEVKLPDPSNIFERYPHEISGGQKQRVMIAMAMSTEPSILIADEATTALDVTVQKSIIELMADLQKRKNMGIMFITHDLGLVADIADDIIVLYKGNIVETGDAQTILKHPKHPYTKALLACRPILHKPGERLPMVSDFMTIEGDENRIIKQQKNGLPITQEPLIEVDQVCIWYPKEKNIFGKTTSFTKAVDDVSFTIYKGETLGVVGESGCGKTTLGRALLRLAPLHSGSIRLEGQDLYALTAEEIKSKRKDIQLIFQDPYSSLNPRHTIGNTLQEVMHVHKIGSNKKERLDITVDLLEKVGLKAEHINRYPHEFSGGQRQRIGIARALALQPSFLVCDESVSALDVSVQAQVLNLLNDLKQEFGFTIFFISHDLSVIHYLSDRIMVMQKGKIVESGAAGDVFYRPQHPYTQTLMNALPGRSILN